MEQEGTHEAGEQLGPYTLERPLGRGAAAEVWQVVEAGSLGFQKRQALKLLRPPPGEMETQKKALINEARVCGRLKHPGVVDVYRVGEEGGELYIAMEFVDGPDLNTLLVALRRRSIQLPVRASIEAAIDLAEALHYAHEIRDDDDDLLYIVHRDLKPSNVLVDRRGVLKISDWGLVKSTLNIESTTRGIVKGTPGYIAPEVWGGTRDFKPAADLFAVGAMLYEFIVGERLFQGRNLARIAEQVARRKPEDEAARVAERCPPLVPVLTKLLQRAPGNRYQTGADLAEDLRPIQEQYRDEALKTFLRGVRGVVDEIAPISRSSRMSQQRKPAELPAGSPGAKPSQLPVTDPSAARPGPVDLVATGKNAAVVPADEAPTPPQLPASTAPELDEAAATGPMKPPERSGPVAAPATARPTGGAAPGPFSGGGGWVQGQSTSDVPATRAMAPSSTLPVAAAEALPTPPPATETPAGAATSPHPDESSVRLGPDGRPRRRKRRHGQGGAARKGGGRRTPPATRRFPPPLLATSVALVGVLLLLLGIAAVVWAWRNGMLPF
jgi:serine/threonine protein kinase